MFEQIAPRADIHDLLGEGWGGRNVQLSIDRGMFYCFANKISSVFEGDQQCMEGNYLPAWTGSRCTYGVKSKWPFSLWWQYKISSAVYNGEYLYRCRDSVPGRKRNYETVVQRDEKQSMQAAVSERVARFRANPDLCPPFPSVPAATTWLEGFHSDKVRYPILIALGTSDTGKTEWAHSLFNNALELKIGTLPHFPEKMRTFNRKEHDGIILDDVRDLEFLSNHQDKIQGKYNGTVEFASTPGGGLAYEKDLFAVAVAVTINYSTRNLAHLQEHDWLGKPANRVLVHFPLNG